MPRSAGARASSAISAASSSPVPSRVERAVQRVLGQPSPGPRALPGPVRTRPRPRARLPPRARADRPLDDVGRHHDETAHILEPDQLERLVPASGQLERLGKVGLGDTSARRFTEFGRGSDGIPTVRNGRADDPRATMVAVRLSKARARGRSARCSPASSMVCSNSILAVSGKVPTVAIATLFHPVAINRGSPVSSASASSLPGACGCAPRHPPRPARTAESGVHQGHPSTQSLGARRASGPAAP